MGYRASAGCPTKFRGGAKLNSGVGLFGVEEKQKEPYEMNIDGKLAAAEKAKAEGTAAFKAEYWATAARKYSGGFKYCWEK